MKHAEIELHFVRERVAIGDVRILHMPTTSQFMDIFTKGLPASVFFEFGPVSTFAVARVSIVGGGVLETCCIINTWVQDHLLCEAWPGPLRVPSGWG
jgi:hypothetical protein